MIKYLTRFAIVTSMFLASLTSVHAYEHTVMVRVVSVTPDWMPYASTDGWTQAVSIKESNRLKYFEVAIWQENASVHLYEFPNDYDPFFGQGKSDQEKIDYREQFALSVFSDMPGSRTEKSAFIKSAFLAFIDIIAARYPHSSHALSYSGHGGPGGALFAGELAPGHAQDVLHHWTDSIQSKLAFIDMGGPCNKGGYSDLNAFCPFSRFYIASDLPNGGYMFDDWTFEKYNETNPDYRYHDLISNNITLEQVLEKRIDLKRMAYEYSKNNMILNRTAQANYLYSCEAFKDLYDLVEPIKHQLSNHSDLLSALQGYPGGYTEAFYATIVHQADNRDFFDWNSAQNWNFSAANGILAPNSLGFSPELEVLGYPVLNYPPKQNRIHYRKSIVPFLVPLLDQEPSSSNL